MQVLAQNTYKNSIYHIQLKYNKWNKLNEGKLMKNEVREKIKKYKELKADIVDINIRIAEKERECIGISAMPQGERISPTYKITSSVESQAEKHMEEVEKLLHMRFIKENKIKRIDNALSILDEVQREVIESVLIHNKRYCYVGKIMSELSKNKAVRK